MKVVTTAHRRDEGKAVRPLREAFMRELMSCGSRFSAAGSPSTTV